MYINSNLTPREAFRIHGALDHAMIERLIDDSEALKTVSDAQDHLNEAENALVSEDFLSDVISDLEAIAKRLRGDNRADLLGIAQKLQDLELSTGRAMEYAKSELAAAG